MTTSLKSIGTALAFLALSLTVALAVTPDEILSDPKLEARAREISQHLRCVVCQNQSIDDSNAPLAKDLRVLVRERLTAGDTNTQAMDFIVARYGTFVLLKPPVQANTLLLWFAPALILALAALAAIRILKRQQSSSAAGKTIEGLSAAEEARLSEVLAEKSGGKTDATQRATGQT